MRYGLFIGGSSWFGWALTVGRFFVRFALRRGLLLL